MVENSGNGLGDERVRNPQDRVSNFAFFAKRAASLHDTPAPAGAVPDGSSSLAIDLGESSRRSKAETIDLYGNIRGSLDRVFNPRGDRSISNNIHTIAEWMRDIVVSTPVLNEEYLRSVIDVIKVYTQSIEERLVVADRSVSPGIVVETIIQLCLEFRQWIE